jgi:hypothetical protein
MALKTGVVDDPRQVDEPLVARLRESIQLQPTEPAAYFNLGAALEYSIHHVEAGQRYLEAKERYPEGSAMWGPATARAFDVLKQAACDEVAKPEWWNDEDLKVLSAQVVTAAPQDTTCHYMRAVVLSAMTDAWKVGPRTGAELEEAAVHFEQAGELSPAPAGKEGCARMAKLCRSFPFGTS